MLSEFSLIDRFFARRAAARVRRRTRAARSASATTARCSRRAPAKCWRYRRTCWSKAATFSPMSIPQALGHKALAVNLSDLAAMGAKPRAFTLALVLAEAPTKRWLAAFSDGLFALAERYGCELIGGDTTGGPLNLCITVFGERAAARGAAPRRRATGRRHLGIRHARRRARRPRRAARRMVARMTSDDCDLSVAPSNARSRASRSASRCAASRTRRSTSPTASPATCCTSWSARTCEPRSTSTPCRARPRCARLAARGPAALHARRRRRLRAVLHRAGRGARRSRTARRARWACRSPASVQ